MLLIISEGLVKEYEKVKSSVKPKVFAKEHIWCNQRRYDNSSQFYRDYYGSDCGKLMRYFLKFSIPFLHPGLERETNRVFYFSCRHHLPSLL